MESDRGRHLTSTSDHTRLCGHTRADTIKKESSRWFGGLRVSKHKGTVAEMPWQEEEGSACLLRGQLQTATHHVCGARLWLQIGFGIFFFFFLFFGGGVGHKGGRVDLRGKGSQCDQGVLCGVTK